MSIEPQTLFIAGNGRSGSTLLERVLARLPETVALGEVLHMWQRGILENQLCGCGEEFRSCPFWSSVGSLAFGGWDQVDVERVLWLKGRWDRMRRAPRAGVLRTGTAAAEIGEYANYYQAVYSAAARTAGARVVIDSSKQPSLPPLLAAGRGARVTVVHIVRDSRGVAYSWTKLVRRPEITGEDAVMPRYRPTTMALKWNLHNTAGLLARRAGLDVVRVRYEDLVADPVGTVGSIAASQGITVPDELGRDLQRGEVTLQTDHTAAGNPMRFKRGTVQLAADDAWRREMPAAQRVLVSCLTAPALAHYRYLNGAS